MAELVYPPIIGIVKSLWKYLGLQFTFYGEAHVPKKGPAILAMNHVGYLDFAIVGTAVLPSRRLVRFMAKKEIFDNPIAGPLMRGMKHISVDRKNGGPSFIAALRALNKGEIVGVFPEATISQSFDDADDWWVDQLSHCSLQSETPLLAYTTFQLDNLNAREVRS